MDEAVGCCWVLGIFACEGHPLIQISQLTAGCNRLVSLVLDDSSEKDQFACECIVMWPYVAIPFGCDGNQGSLLMVVLDRIMSPPSDFIMSHKQIS